MPDYADCLAAWLAVVGVEQPHVLGLSWGSSVALELYRRHPQVPASLILASAYAGWAGSLSPRRSTPAWRACWRRPTSHLRSSSKAGRGS
jgi:pimeloyl-ACP methyl ester carboxylesterase